MRPIPWPGAVKKTSEEAIDALVKGMEDHRDNLILILAGYQEEMDWFVKLTPVCVPVFPCIYHSPIIPPENF